MFITCLLCFIVQERGCTQIHTYTPQCVLPSLPSCVLLGKATYGPAYTDTIISLPLAIVTIWKHAFGVTSLNFILKTHAKERKILSLKIEAATQMMRFQFFLGGMYTYFISNRFVVVKPTLPQLIYTHLTRFISH